jgi:hypothetical protein
VEIAGSGQLPAGGATGAALVGRAAAPYLLAQRAPPPPEVSMMKHHRVLIVASLLSLLLMIVHLTQDTIRQAEGSMTYPVPVVVLALWLYATLMASDRVWGYVMMLLGGLFSVAMIVVHARGIVVTQSGGFFFVWTLFALSTTGWLTIILAARGLGMAVRARRRA